jgi:hypothetical protein
VQAPYDLDNLRLEQLGDSRSMRAVYELEALMLTGHCFDTKTREPPRGLQLALGSARAPQMVDTIVMANLGYFQLKAAPGVWNLSLVPGRSTELYALAGGGNAGGEDGRGVTREVVVSDFRGGLLHLGVSKRPGKEMEKLLEADEEAEVPERGGGNGAEKEGGSGWQGMLGQAKKWLGSKVRFPFPWLARFFRFAGEAATVTSSHHTTASLCPSNSVLHVYEKNLRPTFITKCEFASFIGGKLKLTIQEEDCQLRQSGQLQILFGEADNNKSRSLKPA